MGRDGPALPFASTKARDVLDLFPPNPILPVHLQADQPISNLNQPTDAPKQRDDDAGDCYYDVAYLRESAAMTGFHCLPWETARSHKSLPGNLGLPLQLQ